ncbi:sorting nexin-10A-like isoform X2 [Salvelinus sp. IW2-2015]|uniref:sorting nexin-10A-like isoform X2 n=1 Tax=Salvelinus sp. IW2-2015 TaxID=2691554 RepID=UPI000CDFAB03|nr:sorting nexin-10A-like isoform X3 [Salvelinus alpinus]
MEIDSLMKQEFVSVWVQEPQFHKDDFWHTHVDYEICLHTNSMCFRKKTSCVRRRYSEFVWLRQRLQDNTMLIILQDPLLLSDSRVHLFLQSQLSVTKMEACVLGQTRYTVAQAIQMCSDCHRTRFPIEKGSKVYFNSDCESLTSTTSSLGHSHDSGVPQSPSLLPFDCSTCENSDGKIRIRDEGFFSSLSESSCDQEHMEP